jgi:hypothetical protein
MYQRIEIVIDLSPKDTHRRLPFSWKNRNARSLAANSGTLQLSDLPGQAGLDRGGKRLSCPAWLHCVAACALVPPDRRLQPGPGRIRKG